MEKITKEYFNLEFDRELIGKLVKENGLNPAAVTIAADVLNVDWVKGRLRELNVIYEWI